MSLLSNILSRGPDEEEVRHHGLIWASFERKREVWHFGPDDQKPVTYDGIEKGALYRLVDDPDPSKTTSFQAGITAGYEIVMYEGNVDVAWKEPIEDPEPMRAVTLGITDDKMHPNHVWYGSEPVYIVTKPEWDQLKQRFDLALKKSASVHPGGLSRQLRKR